MPTVRKRCFVQVLGFEPVAAEEQQRRVIREMARFNKTWSVQSKASALSLSDDEHVAHWAIETQGPNWSVATDYCFLRWDDMVAADATMSDWRRVPLGIAALMEFLFTGTIIRYFVFARRYGSFSLYPIAFIGGMIWLSIFLATSLSTYVAAPYPWLFVPAIALALFSAMRWVAAQRIHLRLLLDDWSFARAMIHQARPKLEERLDRLARELARLVRETDADEIVIHGHSIGAPLALVIIDRALQLDPQLGRRGKPIHFATSGSSLLKFALHPSAGWLREAVGRVANAGPAVYWVEFQIADDFLSVYNVDPVVALGMPSRGMPVVKLIHIPLMLEKATYDRFRFNFWRIHRQPRMGNERRYFYDYYMLCCGPLAVSDWAEQSDRAVATFAADGSLTDTAWGRTGSMVEART